MKKRKLYTGLSLILMASFVLCLGVACNNGTPADVTLAPSAKTTASGQADPQITAGSESALPSQGTPEPQETEEQQEIPVSTQDSQDNVVTFPPSWFETPTDGNETTATKQPTVTKQPSATKQPTATKKPEQSQQPANSATKAPVTTPQPTQPNRDNEATAPTVTQTPKPTPESTPIGTDAEGWIDVWV